MSQNVEHGGCNWCTFGRAEKNAIPLQCRRRAVFDALPYGILYSAVEGCSNCLDCQVVSAISAYHGVLLLIIAFNIVSSLRMQAVRATFLHFPRANRR